MPYGTTRLEWDRIIPLSRLWTEYNRVAKENAAIILFSSQPFTTDLISSNRAMFRYEIIWDKVTHTNFFDAKKRPMKTHENILLFYKKQPTYHPQKEFVAKTTGRVRINNDIDNPNGKFVGNVTKEKAAEYKYIDDGSRYPGTILTCSNWNGRLFGKNSNNFQFHPTQKPVELIRWLIRSYSNPEDVILDNCMGSGTTAIACILEDRHYIGFEINKEYYNLAVQRINAERNQLKLKFAED